MSKRIELKDGEYTKNFIIAKHKAIPALKLVKSIAGLFSKGGLITKENVMNYFGNILGFENTNQTDIDILDLFVNGINGILQDDDDEALNNVLENMLFNVVMDKNGTTITSDNGLYNEIETLECLIELLKEVFMLNFAYFFSEEKKS